jgi:anti-sigma B factor antagonist
LDPVTPKIEVAVNELIIKTRKGLYETTIIELSGQLGKNSAEELETTLKSLESDGHVKILVSCRGLNYLSSEVSSVFVAHLVRIRQVGGDIRFCDVSEDIHSALKATGLPKLLVIFDSEDEALAAFSEHQAQAKEELSRPLSLEQEVISPTMIILAPIGSIDRHTIELLDETLMKILEAGRPQIIIDGGRLTYVSSNGMGVFIGFLSKVRAKQGDLRFFGLNDIVRTVITTLGLHRLFRLIESREEAIASFNDAQP